MLPQTMTAVVFDGPRKISLQSRPVPQLQHDTDIIVKVQAAALCGSELHVYRGHQPSPTGFIMGHEFTGTVVSLGPAVSKFSIGDKIVSPFTTSCGSCFYCRNALSSRCSSSQLFGSSTLDGSQAEYVRIPLADTTALPAPASLSDQSLLLMADIFPTGYYGVTSALNLLRLPGFPPQSDPVMVIIGCGPVGLCAVTVASEIIPPGRLFAVDGVQDRLDRAKSLGAEPLDFRNPDFAQQIHDLTDARGADVVVEAVGSAAALRSAFDLVRPFGVISSIGVHNDQIPITGSEAYAKNIRLQMGRCPVRSVFADALPVLERKQDLLGFMFENVMPLSDAVRGYSLFDEVKVQKVIFKP